MTAQTKKTECKEFENYDEAKEECFKRERKYARESKTQIEVVVFEANSLEDLKKTHSRYFSVENDQNDTSKENSSTVAIAAGAVGLIGLALYLLRKK